MTADRATQHRLPRQLATAAGHLVSGSGGGWFCCVAIGGDGGGGAGTGGGGCTAFVSRFIKSQTEVKSNARRNVFEANACT